MAAPAPTPPADPPAPVATAPAAAPPAAPPGDDRRPPPQHIEAEMAVLGGILLRGEAIDVCIDMALAPEDFYKPSHTRLYDTLRRMRRKGEPIDPITLIAALRTAESELAVGGLAYLAELQARVPTAENIGWWAQAILDASMRRQIVLAVEGVREAALAGAESPAELVARVLAVGEKFTRAVREPVKEGKKAALKTCVGCGRKTHVGACKRGER